MARIDELRLMTKVARLYYEQGMRQSEIAAKLASFPIYDFSAAQARGAGADRACHGECAAWGVHRS